MATRLLRALALAAPLLALAACDARGTVEVTAQDTVVVDISFWAEPDDRSARYYLQNCRRVNVATVPSLVTEALSDAESRVGCRLTGSATFAEVESLWPGTVRRVGGHQVIVSDLPSGFAFLADRRRSDTVDLTVTFPGRVLSTGAAGEPNGRTVRFTDVRATVTQGIDVVADAGATNQWPWLVASATVLGAVMGILGVGWWQRRRPTGSVTTGGVEPGAEASEPPPSMPVLRFPAAAEELAWARPVEEAGDDPDEDTSHWARH